MKSFFNEKNFVLVSGLITFFIYLVIFLSMSRSGDLANEIIAFFQMFGWAIAASFLGFILGMRPILNAGAALGFSIAAIAVCYVANDIRDWLLYLVALPGGLIAFLVLAFLANNKPCLEGFVISLITIPIAMSITFFAFHYGQLAYMQLFGFY